MNAKKLIGLTIAETLETIKKAESHGEIYQVYICEKKHIIRNMKDFYKRVHIHDENNERAYKIIEYDLIIFAKDKEPQKNSFVLDAKITKEYHDNWSFSGYVNTESHNVYYLYVDGIKKDNKGREITANKKEQLIPYKKGELTKAQRRFCL